MKKLLKILCFSLMIGGMVIPTKAGASSLGGSRIVSPMFTNINYFINSLDISSDGEAYVYSYLDVRDSDKATITVYLEKYNTTSKAWSSVKSWTKSEYADVVWMEDTYWVVHGQYRVRAIGAAYQDGVLLEKTTATTATFTY